MACPICDRESDRKYRPFCSLRCSDVDLGRWLTGAYSIPAEDADDVDKADRAPGAGDKPH